MIRDGVGVSVLPRFSLLRPELDSRPVVEPKLSRHVELALVAQRDIVPALGELVAILGSVDWGEAA